MKTDNDALTLLYQYLVQPASKTALGLTGDVYKRVRPKQSVTLEDAVVNALPFNGEQFQRGTLNLNMYVVDLKELIFGIEQTVPNEARLSTVASLAVNLVKEVNATEYSFWVANVATIAQPETSEHYVNIRIDFQFDTSS